MALAVVGVVFVAVYWLSFPRDLGERPVFNSPRESIGYFLTQRALDGHGFSAPLLHFDELPDDVAIALTPRDSANVDGEAVPRDFAGTMLLHAALMFIHPVFALSVGPIFALVSAWALLRLGHEQFGHATGVVAFAAWLAFPPLWINSSFVFSGDLPALAFFLLALVAFMRYWRHPTSGMAVAASIFFCLSVLFRYPNVLLAIPLCVALVAGRRIVIDHLVLAALAGLPLAAVVLVFNDWVYGDPFRTGFHLGAQLIDDTVNYAHESFFKRRPDVLLQYVRLYALLPVIAIPIAVGLVAAVIAALANRSSPRLLAIITLATFAILVAYYGQQDAWGYKSPQVTASFLRYLLPGFALLMLFAAYAVVQAGQRWPIVLFAAPAVVVLAGASFAYFGPGGIADTYATIGRSREVKQQVLAATAPDDIIAVRISDKVLFPERQTLTLTYAIQNEEPFPKSGLETWDHVPPPERFAEVAESVYRGGISLYLMPDRSMTPIAPYQAALAERGFYLRLIRDVDATVLFKVSRLHAVQR